MDGPGQRLRYHREKLSLKYRDVEEASVQIATRRKNDEFIIALSRLSDIENKGTVPSIYRLYSLCTIYRLDIREVMEWYGVPLASQITDTAAIQIGKTHPIHANSGMHDNAMIPLTLDPGLDLRKTVFLSRMIQKWGTVPVTLLAGLDVKRLRYAYVGSEDRSMYPIIEPESLVLIDELQRKIASGGWTSEYDRPIYFVEHRSGFYIGWCTVVDKQLIIQPHPSSNCQPVIFNLSEVDIIGQIIGVAMYWEHAKRRSAQT